MREKPRILMLSENFFPPSTASAQRLYAYAKTLVSHSYDTVVITKSAVSFKSKGITVISRNPKKIIPIFDPILLILYFIESLGIIRKHHIRLIISTVPKINNAVAGFLLSKLFRIPHIIDIRDYWETSLFFYPLDKIVPRGLALFFMKTTSMIYRQANSLITVNGTLKNILIKRGVPHDRIYVIPSGADTSLFRPCENDNCVRRLRERYTLPLSKLILVYGGSLVVDYKFGALLKAVSYLRENDFLLLIIGRPTLLMNNMTILQIAKRLGIKGKVKVMGPLPAVKLAEIFRCCDVGVIPLDDRKSLRHVITAKIFAYLSSGLPVLASGPKNGELEKFLKTYKVGFFVKETTPKEFADALKTIVREKSKIKGIGLRGRKIMEKYYDRYTLSRKIIDVIRHVTGAHHPSKIKS